MRIRSLQTYLSSQNLIHSESLEQLRNKRIGVDAIYWLRSLPNLKDPLADVIGGLPPSLFRVINRSLEFYESYSIELVFVFQGIQPKSYISFYSPLHTQIDEAWKYIFQGDLFLAQQHFAQATSRITSDFVFAASHYLQYKKQHVITAPFFATAQLMYLASIGMIDAIFGPPSSVLFGIPTVIISINQSEEHFDWIRLSTLLKTWNITEKQFIEACLLAGTEYCLTFPCFNILQESGEKFHFGTAIEFIRQAPLMSCVDHFFDGEIQVDYVNGYAVCNAIVKHLLALHTDGQIRAVPRDALVEKESSTETDILPDAPGLDDLKHIFGLPLPNSVYILMSRQLLSRKLPSVLAIGQWHDSLCPIFDSMEYREIYKEILPYRRRALGLIAMRLPEIFHNRPIKFFRCNNSANSQSPSIVSVTPDCKPGLPWAFTAEQLSEEMERQKVTEISFRFCLNWHAYEISRDRTLLAVKGNQREPVTDISNIQVLRATVYFMVLENLGFFTPGGRATIFGSALGSTTAFEEETLVALELMKTGNLMGEPLEPAPERPVPSKTPWLKNPENASNQLSILMLSRVASLIPMSLNDVDLWLQPVDCDLAGYHTIVRVLKKTFRQLMEACLANLLLKDLSIIKVIPLEEMAPHCAKLPIFSLSRNCMGIVFKHFLETEYETNIRNISYSDSGSKAMRYLAFQRRWKRLEVELMTTYQCCKFPINDIFKAIRFWLCLRKIVDLLGQNVDIGCLKSDLEEAHNFLLNKIYYSGLHNHFLFDKDDFAGMRAEIAAMFSIREVLPLLNQNAVSGVTASSQKKLVV